MRKNQKIALRGALIALALVLSYVESFIPVFVAVPGIKIGLANIVTVFALYRLNTRDAIFISLCRILLSAVLFSNLMVLVYSLAGAALSLLAMKLGMEIRQLSVTGVSILGGVFHNVGQVLVAAILLQNGNVFYYLAVLFISGTVSGILIGIFAGMILKRFENL